jgi:hypothetical protein
MPDIYLPVLHAGQVNIWQKRTRLDVIRCGRRWGKTKDLVTIAGDGAAKGKKVGIFTPEHKQLAEPFDELREILAPITKSVNSSSGIIRTTTDGKLDFWTLNDNDLAGRGREYDIVLIDEAAFTKKTQMLNIWKKSIKPTMLTTKGFARVYSTPYGDDPENFFWQCCNNPELGFTEFHAPTSSNPYVPEDELEKERLNNHPLVFRQEYLAEFVDWSGVAFFSVDSLTVDGQGVPMPNGCDYVFAVIDSAMKDGSGNDGTAVIYCAISKYYGHRMVILDWDIVQINSDLLINWLPNVFAQLEYFAKLTKARLGSAGAWIEDKQSGITLNQHSVRMGWPARAIEGDITAVGKDGRAIGASGPVYRGEVKISQPAFEKTKEFKGQNRNHCLSQITSYRIGDKDAAKRSDDLADCFTYAVIIGLNGPDGF